MTTESSFQDYLGSASSLIKALKAPADPPQPSWPSKVDIALEAWTTKELYLPRKAEVLRDWILETLTRPQSKSTQSSAILEPKYYDLLGLTWQDAPQTAPAPLSLLSSFFNALLKETSTDMRLLGSAAKAFELLYRNQHQVKVDAWIEAWRSCLEFLACDSSIVSTGAESSTVKSLQGLLDVVNSLFRPDDLGADAQVKKITAQLYDILPTLIKASSLHPEIPALRQFRQLLPVPILRDQDPLQAILGSITNISPDSVGFTATTFLPELLHTFIDQLQKHKYQVFTQPSSSKKSFDVFVSDKLRIAVQSGFKEILDYLERVSRTPNAPQSDLWEGRARLWSEISRWGGYLESDEAWGILLQNQAIKAKEELQGDEKQDLKNQQKVIELLDILERLDHHRTDLDIGVVAWGLASPKHCHVEAETLLSSILRYHQLTFSLRAFFELFDAAITSLFPADLDPDTVRQIYDLVSYGPLQSPLLQSAILSAVSALPNPAVRVEIMHGLVTGQDQEQDDDDAGERTAKRKRKSKSGAGTAASLAITTRLAVLLLPSGVTWEDDTMFDDNVKTLLSRLVKVNGLGEESSTKKHKKSRKSGGRVSTTSWAADIVLAAQLRLIRSLEKVNRQWEGGRPQADMLLGRLEDESASVEVRIEILSTLSQGLLVGTSTLFGFQAELTHRFTGIWLELLERAETEQDALDDSFASIVWDLLKEDGLFVFNSFATDPQRSRLLEQLGRRLSKPSSSATLGHESRLLGAAEVWELRGIRDSFVGSIYEGLNSTDLSIGLLSIVSQCPMALLPRDLRESLSKYLSARLRHSGPQSLETSPAVEWLARVARDQDSVRWIDPAVLPWLLENDWDESKSALGDLVTGLTKHLSRRSSNMFLLLCLDQLKGRSFEQHIRGTALVTVELFITLLDTIRNIQELPTDLESELRESVPFTASKLAHALSNLMNESVKSNSSGVIALVQLYVTLLQLLHRLNLPAPKTSITKQLLHLAAGSGTETMPQLSPLIIEITHEETGGKYSEETLATLTLLNALSSSDEANKPIASIMRNMVVDNFALAMESSIVGLALHNKRRSDTTGKTHPRMTIAHLRTVRTLIGIPLEGSGKVMRKVCVPLQDAIARVVNDGDVEEVQAAMQCLEQLVLARSRIIRPMDFATTCGILSAALRPNGLGPKPRSSHYDIFDCVIGILSSIARLRADLVAECPAEVVGVISSMFTLFFEPRRQYSSSARARTRVTSRWPAWLADPIPTEPRDTHKRGGLKASHAAQLSRLLTNICQAKLDTPRNPSRPGSSSIANSLVKHVPAVLVAYCRAVGDPWGSLSADIRKELEPGLWNLCEVLTAGGRVDARGREGEGLGSPFGLGEGGEVEKEVWAAMWLNWSKYRYQGKG